MYATQGPQFVDRQTYSTREIAAPLMRPVTFFPTGPTWTAAPYSANNVVIPPSLHTYGSTPVTTHVVHGTGPSLLTRCACEFLGTLLFFLGVVLCSNALYIAAFYVALIYAFWFISGAHLNPAISLASVVAGKMPVGAFLAYGFAQIAGGSLGGLIFKYIFAGTKLGVTVAPVSPYTLADAVGIEVLYTTLLTFVALNVMCSQRNDNNQFYGIALGFVIVAGGFAAQTVSAGALFNPALCFGLMTSSFKVGSCFWYVLAELVSAVLAASLFKLCRFRDQRVDHDIFYEIEHGPRSPRSQEGVTQLVYDIAHSSLTIRMCSEFLGTFWLVITIILNTALANGYAALSGAGVLISLIYALGDVSGGHFNPAVTLAIVVGGRNKCSSKDGACYVFAQLLSAIPAGILASRMSKETGLFALTSSYSWFPIGFAEFVFTLILAYVVLVVTTSEMHTSYSASRPNFYYALAIGFIFVGGSYAIGNISGGYLNPAVALGFAVDAVDITSKASVTGWPSYMDFILKIFSVIGQGITYFAQVLAYWFPEIVGAIVAALLFHETHRREFDTKTVY